MSDAYIGEIRIFAGNFAPKGWALCGGQLMAISQNTALFSILGTQYGGDGKTNFALPNLNGRVPIGQGNGAGLTPRSVGEDIGSATVTLLTTETPMHTHVPMGSSQLGSTNDPNNAVWGEFAVGGRGGSTPVNLFNPTPNTPMSPVALNVSGNSQPHNNMQPCLAMNYIICLDGEFPPRS
ncbi:phage tail protein [Pseudoduganella sp. GCM10020061]|uniref:phage tail protein n=1 Tax=Pseudoduganella sp. GCM10020061 TaxID=3317345 RepID=UPI003635F8C2